MIRVLSLFTKTKTALNENMLKLTEAYKTGEINTNQFGQYQKIMKDSLKQSLTGIRKHFFLVYFDRNHINFLYIYLFQFQKRQSLVAS